MRILSTSLIAVILTVVLRSEAGGGEPETGPGSKTTETNVLEMTSVPDGHFLVNLQVAGKEHLLNIKVITGVGVCVASDDTRFKGLRGEFRLIGNGVFVVFFQNDHHRASQYWLFRAGGRAVVREVPDRGEKQLAIPLPDDSLEVGHRSR